jgi:hypothetical protein
MKANKLILLLTVFAFILVSTVSGPGCANIVPPAGGPRDSLPPLLLKATPGDSTKNFTGNRISFVFDDYVEIQNVQTELLVSPTPKTNPIIEYRLNTVTVKIKDTLEPYTTYTIDFGNAIKDVNEGNVLKNFKYTFSTGYYIDSLEFSGKVMLAETGRADSTLFVLLHTSADDSAVVNDKPRYVARTDGNGNFKFTNLPPKTYYVYALKDEGSSRRYLSEKQLFAFADSPVVISRNTPPVTLYAYVAETESRTPSSTIPNRPNRGNAGNAADRRLKITTSAAGGQQDLLSRYYLNFEQPLKVYDSTKVGFFMDSTFTPVPNWRLVKDSNNRRLNLLVEWKENTTYHLVLDKEFAEDSTGKKLLRSDTVDFRTKKIADYGEIKIKLRNLDMSKNPVLLFVQNGTVLESYPLAGPDFAKKLFMPGEYDLRILYDENKNGKWDPGDFFKKRQPERVKPIEQKISIKANWENEFERTL